MRIRYGDLAIDTDRLVITRAGVDVDVQPQVFDMLSHLPGRTVPRGAPSCVAAAIISRMGSTHTVRWVLESIGGCSSTSGAQRTVSR